MNESLYLLYQCPAASGKIKVNQSNYGIWDKEDDGKLIGIKGKYAGEQYRNLLK